MNVNQFIPTNYLNAISNLDSSTSSTDNNGNSNGGLDFGAILSQKLGEVNDQQVNADNLTTNFLEGGNTSVDQVMLGTQEANLSLDMAVQVRNKIVDAYQELNKMQV